MVIFLEWFVINFIFLHICNILSRSHRESVELCKSEESCKRDVECEK